VFVIFTLVTATRLCNLLCLKLNIPGTYCTKRRCFRARRGQLDLLGLQDLREIKDQKVFQERKETKVKVERTDREDQKVIG